VLSGILLAQNLLLILILDLYLFWPLPGPVLASHLIQKGLLFLSLFSVILIITSVFIRGDGKEALRKKRLAAASSLWWLSAFLYFGFLYICSHVFDWRSSQAFIPCVLLLITSGIAIFYLIFRALTDVRALSQYRSEILFAAPFLVIPPVLALVGMERSTAWPILVYMIGFNWWAGLTVFLLLRYTRASFGFLLSSRIAILILLSLVMVGLGRNQFLPTPPEDHLSDNNQKQISYRSHTAPLHDVVIISVDTLRSDVLGCYGDKQGLTPAIDALAADGVMFKNAYSPSPWTLPSMASMLSALYPSVHEGGDRCSLPSCKKGKRPMSARVVRMPQILEHYGFRTALFYDNQYLSSLYKLNYGFLRHEPISRFSAFFDFLPEHAIIQLAEMMMEKFEGIDARINYLEWIIYEIDGRVMLWIHFLDPHIPYCYHQEALPFYGVQENKAITMSKLDRKRILKKMDSLSAQDKDLIKKLYLAEVRFVDEKVAQVLKALKVEGRYDDSIIIFISDHGEEFFEHGGFEHGHSQYNELIQVPLIIKLPGGEKAGTVIEEQAGLVDIMPTVLEIQGIKYKGPMQGRSLMPVIYGKEMQQAPPYFSEYMLYSDERKAVIMDNEKLIVNKHGTGSELYNMAKDPLERDNLIKKDQKTRETLDRLLNQWRKQCQSLNQQIIGKDQEPIITPPDDIKRDLKALGYIE
jgi:arylsulfatase A-like enzyme